MQAFNCVIVQRVVLAVVLLALAGGGVSCRTMPKTSAVPMIQPVRVALVSDTHVTRGAKDSQPFHRVRFQKAIAEVNAVQPDLVLVSGDLTENGTPEEYRDFKELIRQFRAPVWYVPGNHDVGSKNIPGKKPTTSPERMKSYERALGPSWWVREQGGLRVIGANGPLFGSGFPQEKRMWETLEAALAQPSKTPTLFMLHYPPFQKTNTEPGGVYWNLEPYPRARLLGLLKQGGVKTVLSGHLHQKLTNNYDGITLLTTTTVAHGDPLKKAQFGWVLLTVATNGAVKIEPQALKFDEPPFVAPPAGPK